MSEPMLDAAGRRRSLATLLEFHAKLQREGPHDRLVAHRLTRELLSLPKPPTAIFAASDTQALGVLEAAGFEASKCPTISPSSGSTTLEVAALSA
jgi:DNA-binding LacI/PurR family transcriptional regulator